MKTVEEAIPALAERVLVGSRRKDGLTCYAHAENRAKDLRHMTETLQEELPRFFEEIGVHFKQQ